MYRKEEEHDVGSLAAAQNVVRPVTLWLAPFTHRLAGLVYISMETIQAYFTVQAPPPRSHSQTIFRHMGKIGLVNGLFHSHSLRQNVGGPIRLLCESDVIIMATKKAEQSRQCAGD